MAMFLLATGQPQAAEPVHGTVISRLAGDVIVSVPDNGGSAVRSGDAVDFIVRFDGMDVDAGRGEVIDGGSDRISVRILQGQPDLKHLAVIHASGQIGQSAPSALAPEAGTATATSAATAAATSAAPAAPPAAAVWGRGSYERVDLETPRVNAVAEAHRSCEFERAHRLALEASADFPGNAWLRESLPTLEILARRARNYRVALNAAFSSLERGAVDDSIGQIKVAMQNASVQCGQDQQVRSLLDQAQTIAAIERDQAIEAARRRSLASSSDSADYRRKIAETEAERETIGNLLTGNLLGLLGALNGRTPSASTTPAPTPSNGDVVRELVDQSESRNREILDKWRASQGWPARSSSATARTPDSRRSARTGPAKAGDDLVSPLVKESERNNADALRKWRESQGWK